MNQYETMLLLGFVAFFLAATGLYHLMAFRVNRQLPPDRRIPYCVWIWGARLRIFGPYVSARGWYKLAEEYKGFYPGSHLYQYTLTCAITSLIIGAGFAAFRVWEYATGR